MIYYLDMQCGWFLHKNVVIPTANDSIAIPTADDKYWFKYLKQPTIHLYVGSFFSPTSSFLTFNYGFIGEVVKLQSSNTDCFKVFVL